MENRDLGLAATQVNFGSGTLGSGAKSRSVAYLKVKLFDWLE